MVVNNHSVSNCSKLQQWWRKGHKNCAQSYAQSYGCCNTPAVTRIKFGIWQFFSTNNFRDAVTTHVPIFSSISTTYLAHECTQRCDDLRTFRALPTLQGSGSLGLFSALPDLGSLNVLPASPDPRGFGCFLPHQTKEACTHSPSHQVREVSAHS